MNKPWFGKKIFGWGWGLPLRWQGWVTLIAFVTFVISIDFITTDLRLFIPLVLVAIMILFVIARTTSGKPEWGNGEHPGLDKKTVITRALILFAAIVTIVFVSQTLYLRKAHSTFENYYHFRGCTQLIEKTDTYGTCQLPSGQVIKIVEINNKWYLDGDGPGVF